MAIVEQDPLSINSVIATIRVMATSEAQADELISCLPQYEHVAPEDEGTEVSLADLEKPIGMKMCMIPIKLIDGQIAIL